MDTNEMETPTNSRRPDHKSKSNLGKAGYKAMLVNLPAALKQYEGMTTTTLEVLSAADRKSSGIYNIHAVSDISEDTVHLSLRGKYLEPFVDRASSGDGNSMKLELAKLSKLSYYNECVTSSGTGVKKESGSSANNRSSVKIAYENFIQSFRKAIQSNSAGAKAVLEDMDEDGNGAIDKKEMLLGAHMLGVAISPAEMEMIWPMFGPFDSALRIPVNHFLENFVTNKTKGNRQAHMSTQSAMMSLQKVSRQERIGRKTQLANRLATLSVGMRANVVAKMGEMSLNSAQLFAMMDTDRGGTLDKQEFHRGLEKLGIGINDTDLAMIWPLFNLDLSGTISKVEWARFVDDNVEWSFKYVADKFSNLVSSEEDEIAAASAAYQASLDSAPKQKTCSTANAIMHHLGVGSPRVKRRTLKAPACKDRDKGKVGKSARSAIGRKLSNIMPKTHRAFGGSSLLYRRQSITRGYVIEPVYATT
jgi:Ca2+-binding EF-hand superfamily protein